MSAGNSRQPVRMLESLGAEVVLVPQVDGAPGQVTGNDIAAAAQLLNNWTRTVVDSTSTNSTQPRDWSRTKSGLPGS
jgi:cysteine synthase